MCVCVCETALIHQLMLKKLSVDLAELSMCPTETLKPANRPFNSDPAKNSLSFSAGMFFFFFLK